MDLRGLVRVVPRSAGEAVKPRIIQITAAREGRMVDGDREEGTILYGLAEDGSVWSAEPNTWHVGRWERAVSDTVLPDAVATEKPR